jgi:hypothetical protein
VFSVKTASLKRSVATLQTRISKFSAPIQGIFFEDLAEATKNRLRVLEKAWLEKRG